MAVLLKLTGLSWPELIRAIWRGSVDTNVTNRAAELAFWFLLGFSHAFVRYKHGFDNWLGTGFARHPDVLCERSPSLWCFEPGKTRACADDGERKSLVFTPLRGVVFLVCDHRAYRHPQRYLWTKERRPWWKYRLIAVGLAIAMGVLLTAALIILVYGPLALDKIAPGSATLYVWKIAQWPAAALLLIIALLGLYRFAPNLQQQRWKWLLPGSMVAAVTWMAVSVLFKLYVRHFSHFGLLYGSLGTLIILMFWFYLSGAAILVGGVIDAILEDAAARTKRPWSDQAQPASSFNDAASSLWTTLDLATLRSS